MISFKKLLLLISFLTSFSIFSSFKIYDEKPIESVRNNEITKEEIFEHIKYLSSDKLEGRFPGTKGIKLAQEYIKNEYEEYDLDPHDTKDYLQSFEMMTGIKLGTNNHFSITNNNIKANYKVEEDFIPYGFSSNTKIEGDLVFCGYGINAPELNYNDYKNIDVKNKIAVVFRYIPPSSDPHNNPFAKYESLRYKAFVAREFGAKGVIFITGPESDPTEDKLLKLFPSKEGSIIVIQSKRKIFEDIFEQLNLNLKNIQSNIDSTLTPNSFSLTGFSSSIQVDLIPINVKTNNVIGFVEGNDEKLKNEVIVIGAHYDHLGYGEVGSLHEGHDKQIHNGADDNASGVAGVLELAQKFSENRDQLKRSILFICFSGEEEGLLGSVFFTESDLFKKLNIITMLNMDMVGRLDIDKLAIYGVGTSNIWKPSIEDLNKKYNFSFSYIDDGFGPSDHSSFYQKNIPVLHFFSGTHSDYHKPSDDYEKINLDGEVKILNLIYDLVQYVDDSELKPDFIKVTTPNDQTRPLQGVKVYVGTIPDYTANVEGMKISGVKPGSPAEKGGLQGGDIIIKFGNKEIKNIYDYTYALAEFKPGEEVEIVVIRNNEKVNLKVVLGSK